MAYGWPCAPCWGATQSGSPAMVFKRSPIPTILKQTSISSTLDDDFDSYKLRKRYLHEQGYVVWTDLTATLVRADDGEPLHFISQIVDVTEQMAYEQRLQAAHAEVDYERQTLEAIFETVHVGLLLIGPDGSYQRMNRHHQENLREAFPEGHAGKAGQLGSVYRADGKRLMDKEEMPSYRAAHGEEFRCSARRTGCRPTSTCS